MWKEELTQLLPLLGHRNWIAVVDKAFPLQSSPGIITRYADEDIADVLETVLEMVGNSNHLKPVVYMDAEMNAMDDTLCPGVESLKNRYETILKGNRPEVILHDQVFEKFDEASKYFTLYVIKTDCLVPYSSIFIDLDCGYWSHQCEVELRNRLTE